MHLFHKWKAVPCDGHYDFLRKCEKCGQKQAKGYIVFCIPKFSFHSGINWVLKPSGNIMLFYGPGFLISFSQKKRLFEMWRKIK